MRLASRTLSYTISNHTKFSPYYPHFTVTRKDKGKITQLQEYNKYHSTFICKQEYRHI